MAKGDIKLEGFKELDRALAELGNKSTERTLLRRVAKKALEPIRDDAKRLVPVDEGELRDSIHIGGKMTKRARAADRKQPKHGMRLHMGTARSTAVAIEFGTYKAPAQPFMRPAWSSGKAEALYYIARTMGDEIEKTAARAAKRRAKK